MWIRPTRHDGCVVLHYTGVFLIGMGAALMVPLLTAIVFGEWDPALDYFVGASLSIAVGGALRLALVTDARVNHTHALAIVAFGWLAASFVGAVPLRLSGHFPTYIDAFFEVVSGLTTSGLFVAVDLDHMAHAHNMWRHLTHFIGGQGIVVAALSLAVGLKGGAFSLYSAEGRDERVMPNVLYTARFIWVVALTYVGIGTAALWALNTYLGMSLDRGFLHALWLAVAAYDTGGFAPMSTNIMYYHSYLVEGALVFLMLGGTMNFNLHAQVWRGDRAELWRDIELRIIALNVAVLSAVVAVGMVGAGVMTSSSEVIRKGAFHVLSAHSGTGHQSVYASQWLQDMGGTAFAAIILAMAAGGAVSSTAGGIKALRIGLVWKAFVHAVKKAVSPPSAVVTVRYHHLRDTILNHELASAASLVLIMYLVTYITGAIIGMAYGYGAAESLFESVSAAANVGLSAGITMQTMPVGLKVLYAAQMWAGRLEFMAVLVLVAWAVLSITPQRRRAV